MTVFEGREILGTLSAYVVDIGLPGGVDANATALVDIGVALPHRGEGLARRLIAEFLEQAHRRGEALAVLNSDLPGLYERFGFGIATESCSVVLAHLPGGARGDLDVRLISANEAETVLPRIFEATRGRRVGEVARTPSWWREHFAEAAKGPVLVEFAVLAEDSGSVGYAAFARPLHPGQSLTVSEIRATDEQAFSAIIDFVSLLVPEAPLQIREVPSDDAATYRDATGAVEIDGPHAQLWLRLVDVARAVGLRRFAFAFRTVIEIRDDLLEWNRGRFAFESYEDHSATLRASSEQPALAIGVAALARVFLGGTTFTTLADAGELEVYDEAVLTTLDRAFAVERSPFCSTLL